MDGHLAKKQLIQMSLETNEEGNFIPASNFLHKEQESPEETYWKLNHGRNRFERIW